MNNLDLPIGVSARDYAASLRHAADRMDARGPRYRDEITADGLRRMAGEAQGQADREWADYSAWVSGNET